MVLSGSDQSEAGLSVVGVGDVTADILVYIANRPPVAPYDRLNTLVPLRAGEISDIVEKTGNHWRKIFNLYAKLGYFLTLKNALAIEDRSVSEDGPGAFSGSRREGLTVSLPEITGRTGVELQSWKGLQSRKELQCWKECQSWQEYRDHFLLQAGSRQALLFSEPVSSASEITNQACRVVMGKQYAQSLGVANWFDDWNMIDEAFSISRRGRMILCPYFDYRQLSNDKLDHLVRLVTTLI
ncbi:DUF6942 family protein [Hahella ganghwensis]|uniref:DUF6942 family protein n=1 Tax=Hahella ganghwensis TaxID=286420 RepID=UPI0003684277|nr:hypothetical protein [Hahella ganghwensis]